MSLHGKGNTWANIGQQSGLEMLRTNGTSRDLLGSVIRAESCSSCARVVELFSLFAKILICLLNLGGAFGGYLICFARDDVRWIWILDFTKPRSVILKGQPLGYITL
jgi:hypothetical protein